MISFFSKKKKGATTTQRQMLQRFNNTALRCLNLQAPTLVIICQIRVCDFQVQTPCYVSLCFEREDFYACLPFNSCEPRAL